MSETTTLSRVIDSEQMQAITSEFNRLGERCYLEHAGAALYPQSLLQHVHEDLLNNVYMNPHTDKYTRDCIEQIRCLVLNHFHTDPSKYSIIFTSGATQSLKLTVESFEFSSNTEEGFECGSFVYLNENHTSVLGLREIAEDKNVDVINISHDNFLKSIKQNHPAPSGQKSKTDGNILLAYPAKSNFNGFKYPLDCIQNIKNGCLNRYLMKHLCKVNCNWYVLLDAAAYVPTNNLDLSITQPDFVCLSFYKIFGYPTGLGALLVKNTSADVLCKKRYFGGGTVDIVISGENFHIKRKILHERMEDGTLPFLSILALKHCFDMLHRLIPKTINNHIMDTISHHTFYLAKDLYNQLNELHHPNGKKAVVLYMDSDFSDIKIQGGIVTFNLLREDGSFVGFMEFQNMADLFNINVRTGCFCNSGSCQRHLNTSNREMKEMYKAGHKCGDEIDLINGNPTGAIRVSFGYYNTFNDVDKLVLMVCRCFVRTVFKKPKRTMTCLQELSVYKPVKKAYKEGMIKLLNERSYFNGYDILPETPLESSDIILDEIAIFPIKSCGAFKIKTSWKIGLKGFEYDREWMIIRENGVCLTQKQSTQMCMIKPEIDLKRKLLILHFKGKPSISVPLEPIIENKTKFASMCTSKVCMDMVKGYDCGDDVSDWISNALGISFLRLIKQSSTDVRPQKKNADGEQKLLSLCNQAQFLLINKASVRWLHGRIKDPMFSATVDNLTDRFRGNLIIDRAVELTEREWHRIIIGKHEFKVDGPCQRCHMICIDQQTGEKTAEPLRTISEQFAGKMRFGIYLSYVGPVNGMKDKALKVNSIVKPMINEDDISR
ncbi:PREDICTED: molybdenum cofactor sulfurase [Papilio xuthus]|uniref:Molybdenum cofactor sulfurase n=1 Tax=Papilio xuthus TaxID=66420 RepID=A0A194PDN4_PAPXU|nr:PREDICTED: molybdenum cofactor sulfurase [Papilio xuthus]XP_013165020.1 PREDICTED: molybdenum cofactor sulfurase [Papilio xuthus]XP_013165021.1 PREDICTED: molybdenum cofactor sulfurase [Papilio xuthus]XP_013165022.1 PREDICTED: molybdenum cofactor sulfurase [Papilio xuthus]XP_013165023.1 PREDICTED: molybdenum cofactor sulfurase [Papilio xuthus]KPI91367.1 Molybdenum cofactor sulfurase [Papilio xuthus]